MRPPNPDLQRDLEALGLSLATAEGQTLFTWIERDLSAEPQRRAGLADAVALGRTIFQSFVAAFHAFYLDEGGCGPRRVRQYVRHRFGCAPAPVVEAVLHRIRDRWDHLLNAFRRKYQPSLFAPSRFQPDWVEGYLRQVAWVESAKAPLIHPGGVVVLSPSALDTFPARPDEADDPDFRDRVRLLVAFWGDANGFGRPHRLEGLVSLALGSATGEAELERRCREHLNTKVVPWSERHAALMQRVSQLLDRQGMLEARRGRAWQGHEIAVLDRQLHDVHARIEKTRAKLTRHHDRLLPRPAEVQKLLAGFVDRQAAIRFQRLGREVAVLDDRVCRVGSARQSWPEPYATLAVDVLAHRKRQPASPRQKGLTDEERHRCRSARAAWLAEGCALVTRVRQALTDTGRSQPTRIASVDTLRPWLCDVLDLYELGLLDRRGVIGGLKARTGWRLGRLLRVPS